MLKPLREAQKAAGEGCGDEQMSGENDKAHPRRRIKGKTKPTPSTAADNADTHVKVPGGHERDKSCSWLSLHVDDFSMCGTHQDPSELVKRAVHTMSVFSNIGAGDQKMLFAKYET